MAIPRRFAIAAKEVTVEQFQRFLKEQHHNRSLPAFRSNLDRYSPDPEGPWIGPDWYTAAAYCNWLSEQEGLPKDQWCYLPNEAGSLRRGDDDPCRRPATHGLSPADRGGMGIRLPGRCGHQPLLRSTRSTCLDAYAWYHANSRITPGRAAACCPTTWGCSTCWGTCMNGVRTVALLPTRQRRAIYNDDINISESINEKSPRLLRGGSFNDLPADVRSADRNRYAPADRFTDIRFPPLQDLPLIHFTSLPLPPFDY